jgi:hypothetical protein
MQEGFILYFTKILNNELNIIIKITILNDKINILYNIL